MMESMKTMEDKVISAEKEERHEVAKKVQALLEANGWKYEKHEGKENKLVMPFRLTNLTAIVIVTVSEEVDAISVKVLMPEECDQKFFLAINDYFARTNYSLRYGAFHIDHDDGELSYRYATQCKVDTFNEETIDDYIRICMNTVDKHYPVIERLATGQLTSDEKKRYLMQSKMLVMGVREE